MGEAYQAADDIRDAAADPDEIAKPTGRDAALGCPNAVIEFGIGGAIRRLEQLVGEAIAAIPSCRGAADLKALILLEVKRLLPRSCATRGVTRIYPASVGSVIAKTFGFAIIVARTAVSQRVIACSPMRDFRRCAAAFPLTRWVARRRAQALFDVCAGFVYSQVLFACVELGVFDILSGQPQTVAQLSLRLSLSTQATQRLLDAAASLRLVERRGPDRFGLGALGAALLGNPAVTAMVEHHRLLYADLLDPVALLRGARRDTALSRYWPYACSDRPEMLTAEQVRDYTALMSASQALIAGDVLDAYPLHGHRRLLDVGGGEGTFLIAATSLVRGA